VDSTNRTSGLQALSDHPMFAALREVPPMGASIVRKYGYRSFAAVEEVIRAEVPRAFAQQR
jgi:hypothetical protein